MEGSELEASFERYVATLDFINSFLEAEGFADTKNIFSKEIQSRLRHSPEAVSEGDGQEVTNSPTPDDDHDEATASLADHARCASCVPDASPRRRLHAALPPGWGGVAI